MRPSNAGAYACSRRIVAYTSLLLVGCSPAPEEHVDASAAFDQIRSVIREFAIANEFHFDAEGTFEENGTDTIWLYDDDLTDFNDSGVYDVIDLSDTLDFEDTDFSGTITDEEKEDQLGVMFTYDDGELQTAGNDAEVWFNVFTDAGMTVADTVYVEVDGDQFMSDGSGWDLIA